MIFSNRVILNVQSRQYDGRGLGFTCAKCGIHTTECKTGDWVYIPRIPIKQGGKITDNCVLVCPNCDKELRQDGTKIIPKVAFPFRDFR